MKYRLVKSTKASGFTLWIIQKKFLWWWHDVDAYMDEAKALLVLSRLRSGTPAETKEVIHDR
jgi:hypothetical protein